MRQPSTAFRWPRRSVRSAPFSVEISLGLICWALFADAGQGAVRQAWVARYNYGLTNLAHQAAALALDPSGNLLVIGTSQNTTNTYDYVVKTLGQIETFDKLIRHLGRLAPQP